MAKLGSFSLPTFINVASTMMFCEDVDTWLSGLDTGVLDGGTLHIHDAGGTEIGSLSRVIDDK